MAKRDMAAQGLAAFKPRASRKHQLYESRREREFYRYYEPIRQLTERGPPLCNLHDEAAVKAHLPASSPDRALTAFCQLGALRLGTRRAMLFFFDSKYAYVLAEATRTLSLVDDSVHEIEDNLWLGHSVIPRGFSICEETVCKVPSEDGSDSDSALLHIINDLDKDVQFCDKPYVNDGPKAKFYAGVPITTPKGINIGAYCCLDDRKRDGLDAKGIAFMKDMAATVMTHLEMVRAKAEHERGTQMVCGLNAFIEGASTLRHWEQETERRDRHRMGRQPLPLIQPPLDVPETAAPPPTAVPNTPPSPVRDVSSENAKDHLIVEHVTDAIKTQAETPNMESAPAAPAKTSRHAEDLKDQLIASNVRSAFYRAADLVREAVDVDGAVFLDATPATYGGLLDSTQDSSDQTSDELISGTEATETESESRVKGASVPDKPCKVIASSHTAEDHFNDRGELQHSIQATDITEKFLRSLLRRYPNGKIWNFNADGNASSDDESSECGHRRGCSCRPKAIDVDAMGGSSTRRKDNRRLLRVDDGREIQRLFPGIRSLALVGMWDQNRGRWFASCVVWTYSPLRLFSPELELNYMSAFNDVIMAEVHRLEAQNSERAKSDFISSISHELRSPLHGILGSVEVLLEQPCVDTFGQGLISQIDICGRTLIDIVDNLLDYSKINHHSKESSKSGRGRRTSSGTFSGRHHQLGTLMATDADVALDHITEEVVETAVYSFCCARDKQAILNRKVAVILDIDRSPNISWRCKVPLGGWKRICINLCSNALKYTSEGYIKVSLTVEPIPGKKRKQNIVLTVSDSGRGMSKDFLKNDLFKAFSQEDSLVEGTGLGMSLVAKIVKGMGGQIEVQSEKGHGTAMTVTVPIDINPHSKDVQSSPQKPALAAFTTTKLGILGFRDVASITEPPTSTQHAIRAMILRSVERNCAGLGLQTLHADEDHQADIYLIAEQELRDDPKRCTKAVYGKPLIVLCNSAISLRQLRKEDWMSGLGAIKTEYISQPCGMERLAEAVKNCLGPTHDHQSTPEIAHDGGQTGARKLHFDLPVRTKVAGNENEVFSPSRLAPASLDPINPIKPTTPKAVAGATEGDYLNNRSRSTGDRPYSPHVVDTLHPKQPSARKASSPPTVPPSGLSLLLVDDNAINLQLLVNYAAKQGHKNITATDGGQAVEVYKTACLGAGASDSQTGKHSVQGTPLDKPHVILMDINMPVLNGFEATRRIRQFEQQHGIQPAHVIALTGLGSASAQQEAFSSGVDLFLTKPVRLKELTKVLAEIKRQENEEGEMEASAPSGDV